MGREERPHRTNKKKKMRQEQELGQVAEKDWESSADELSSGWFRFRFRIPFSSEITRERSQLSYKI